MNNPEQINALLLMIVAGGMLSALILWLIAMIFVDAEAIHAQAMQGMTASAAISGVAVVVALIISLLTA